MFLEYFYMAPCSRKRQRLCESLYTDMHLETEAYNKEKFVI